MSGCGVGAWLRRRKAGLRGKGEGVRVEDGRGIKRWGGMRET